MHRKISLVFLTLGFAFSAFTGYFIWKSNLPLVSPVALIGSLIGNSPAIISNKVIYGFFPYWNIKYADELNIKDLTHFAYFSISLNPDGTIIKKTNAIETEPGWNKLRSKESAKLLYQARLLGQKTVLTITAMEPDLIESILLDEYNQDRAVSSITEVYRSFNFDDINIDFEYVGTPSQTLRDSLVSFITKLRTACLSVKNHCQIDVDIFASSAEKVRIWDLPKLEPVVDKFIVMTYDYYRTTSNQAGPIAPIKGRCTTPFSDEKNCLNEDVITHISQISKLLPPNKIILGVPFYGYEWQTASSDFLANTYAKTGTLATYRRIQTLFQDENISSISARWSDSTLSPYLVYQKDGDLFQIHFENAQSLEQKVKLVESAGLGGIAIWSLGYEGQSLDLWDPIKTLIHP